MKCSTETHLTQINTDFALADTEEKIFLIVFAAKMVNLETLWAQNLLDTPVKEIRIAIQNYKSPR